MLRGDPIQPPADCYICLQMRVVDCGASCLLALLSSLDEASIRAIKQIAPHNGLWRELFTRASFLVGQSLNQGD